MGIIQTTATGELAAACSTRGRAVESHLDYLIEGYAGPIHTRWSSGSVAVAVSGNAEFEVFDDLAAGVDGRLDNRREIAGLVGLEPGSSLPELVAEGWRRFGPQLVDRMIGDLAVIMVDRRTDRLYAFRDLCGGRALHVGSAADGCAVATEWQPLAAWGGGARRPSPEWFASAFIGHSVDPAATPYVGPQIVIPGHVASAGRHGWSQRQVAEWHVPDLRQTRSGVYAEQFRELFDQAVACRLPDDHLRAGVSLSGGLDSTSVIASIKAVRPELSATALCLALTDPKGDERSMQAHIAQLCDSELRWVDVDGLSPYGESGPEDLFERFGAPPLVINWFYGDALAAEAQRAGVGVVLDGEDGDGSVGGSNAYLADLLVRGRWWRWLAEVNGMRALKFVSGRDMLRESIQLNLPPGLRHLQIRSRSINLVPDTLSPRVANELNLDDRLRAGFRNRAWVPGRAFSHAQREVGQPFHTAPKYTTISEPWRRRGVELAHPWADRRLMSFCMGLPWVHVRSKAFPKIVLRQAMGERLPRVLVEHNGKADMSEVVDRATAGRDRVVVDDGLALARTQTEWFSPEGVDAVATEWQSGRSVSTATRVAMFARWLRWCDAA